MPTNDPVNHDVTIGYHGGDPKIDQGGPIDLQEGDTVTLEIGPNWSGQTYVESIFFYHDQRKTRPAGSWTLEEGPNGLTAYTVDKHGNRVVITDVENPKEEDCYWYSVEVVSDPGGDEKTYLLEPELINKKRRR